MLCMEIIAVCSQIHTKHINTLCGQNVGFLGAFAKLRKVTVNFVISVRPSVHMEHFAFHCKNFREIRYSFFFFRKCFEKIQVSLQSDKNIGTLSENRCTFVFVFRSVLLRMRNVADWSCRKNQNVHFMFSDIFERKSCRLWDNVEKYGRTGQTTDDKYGARASHAGYRRLQTHTQNMQYLLLSTAAVVAWTLINIALCVQYLPCYMFNLVVNIRTTGLEW